MAKNKEETKKEERPLKQVLEENFRKRHIPYEPSMLTNVDGIRFDFCNGVRVLSPATAKSSHVVEIWDDEKGIPIRKYVLGPNSYLNHAIKYYIKYIIRIYDEKGENLIFQHTFSLKDRPVIVSFPQKTLGDTIAWFSACERFRAIHDCKLICAMHGFLRALFEKAYPQFHFISLEEMECVRAYAHYEMGVNFDGKEDLMPWDWRHEGLHHVGYRILGIDPHWADENPPNIVFDKERREIVKPYVCIGSMASGGCKLWLNPTGWDEVCAFLKKCGYRVIDIDASEHMTFNYMTLHIPREAEDFTGCGEGHALSDRAAMINHADFFIGLGSGLSWLAWALRKPVVLISGFSLPICEFHTPYRVINTHVCHGCFNDTSLSFDNNAMFWCPRQEEGATKMACSTSITSIQVIHTIMTMPEFQEHMRQAGLKVEHGENGFEVVPVEKNSSKAKK